VGIEGGGLVDFSIPASGRGIGSRRVCGAIPGYASVTLLQSDKYQFILHNNDIALCRIPVKSGQNELIILHSSYYPAIIVKQKIAG
jgi:hypothetical protein